MGPGNRPLDLEWLEDFLVLAQTGHFSRAAQERAIAQPAFSRHIRALEEWVGVDLIDRSAHPIELTAAGRQLQPLLDVLLADLQAARIKARAAHDQAAASLRLAVTHVLSLYFFPAWLGGLEAELQPGPVQTLSDSSQACEDMLLQRRVQFVLCHGHPQVAGRLDEGQYPMRVLGDDVLLPVTAADGRGAPLFAITAGRVLPVLAYSELSGLGRILRSQLREIFHAGPGSAATSACQPSVVFTAHNAVLLKTMALKGKGMAWLPRSLVADELRQGLLLDASAGRWSLPLQIRLYRQPAAMAAVAERLWALASSA